MRNLGSARAPFTDLGNAANLSLKKRLPSAETA